MSDLKREDFKVGIIGFGFLGTALHHGFSLSADIKIYDKYKQGFDTIEDTIDHSEFIFFCLPTPMFDDNGEQDISIVENAVRDVHNIIPDGSDKVAIIKSTVLPGTCRRFQELYPKLKFVSNPEHLTARNSRRDFITASKNVLGGEESVTSRVEALYRFRFGNSMPIFKTTWETAEMEKMVVNLFFSVKLTYFNFVFDMCEKLGLDYNEVRDIVMADGRLGRSHSDVGSGYGISEGETRGWGSFCLPKDHQAFINFSDKLGVDNDILKAAWEQNLRWRPKRDWEALPGVMSKRKDVK